jgi:hypothetical protein
MCKIGPTDDDYYEVEAMMHRLQRRLKAIREIVPAEGESGLRFAARLQNMAAEVK